ncbi:MAG: hypothetical protein B7O98_08165 [Zestosphaera tikiterensis]|uniref:HTH dtxR-type domain-containing protein n=1 Tax=Zestosphaera tikiterensis TaxID=1973259 RepID=A0A2R7Y328_9CREN|nr:MAG: hypothetical protein B7O98_08165 [Zestosphaera tikiterensis]
MGSLGGVTERMEDYLRIIYEIERHKGYVRVKDISLKLGVKPSSVVEMLEKLNKEGLVEYEKYKGIRLTQKGREVAELVEKRFSYIKGFLEILLVPEEVALKDAHVLEHSLHPETIKQIIMFVEFINFYRDRQHSIVSWLKKFEKFCMRRKEHTSSLGR